jgi:hypothetical protein
MKPGRRSKDEPVPIVHTADPQDLHWAMHAIVAARSREQYDRMPLPDIPKAPVLKAWADKPAPRSSRQRREIENEPVFGPNQN